MRISANQPSSVRVVAASQKVFQLSLMALPNGVGPKMWREGHQTSTASGILNLYRITAWLPTSPSGVDTLGPTK